jgi:hypothetical protein
MHPLITAYLRWAFLYRLVVFTGRTDLEDRKRDAWQLFRDLRDG